MDLLGQTSLLVALTSFSLGASILARNIRNTLFIAFGLLCMVLFAWSFSFFLAKLEDSETYYWIHLLCNVWLAPVGLYFIREMVRLQGGLSKILLDFSVGLSLCLTVALIFRFERVGVIEAVVYFAPTLIWIQTLELMWIDRRLKKGLVRRSKNPTIGVSVGRRSLIYLGALLVLSTSVMDHVPSMGEVIPSIGNIALTIYLFFLSQAISHQRLLNLEALLTRFLVLSCVALILTGIYSLIFTWIENRLGLFLLHSFVVSFLLLMLLDPIRSLVQYVTNRLLTKKHLKLEQIMKESKRSLVGVVTADALFDSVLMTVDRILNPERSALFVLEADGTKFRRVRTRGVYTQDVLKEVLADHPLLDFCKRVSQKGELPVLLDVVLESEMERSASKVHKDRLKMLTQALRVFEANLLIPLLHGKRLLGFLVVSVPAPPEPWGNNWGFLNLIYPFFELSAETLNNMEVYVRQQEKERLAVLGEMAAGLAHEIRNPLGAIKGAAQFLDPSVDKPESRFLNIILEEVDRLNRVVTQFLDYSKPASRRLEEVDMDRVISKTIENLSSALREPPEIIFKSSEKGSKVLGDSGQLQQVLINLVQNSLNAVENVKNPLIRIQLSQDFGSSPARVKVEIEDNGPGIRVENIDKIFIPFFTTSAKGTGLGLSICQKIVESHGGRIEVRSEEGKFTRFSLYLPTFEKFQEISGERSDERKSIDH